MNSTLFSIRLSLQVATVATIFVFLIGSIVAYFLATRKFRGKQIIEVLITLPVVMPPTVVGYYLIIIFGRNGWLGAPLYKLTGLSFMFSWYGAALASFVVALPLMIKTTQAAISSVDKSMVDSAHMLGYSEFQTAVKVIFPLAKKGLIAGIILAFARAMGEFGATLMIAGNIPGKTDTMPLAIYSLASSGDWGKAHLMVLFLTLTSGLFLYAANRFSRGNS